MEPIPEKIRALLEKQALRGAGDDLNPVAVRKLADKLLIGTDPGTQSRTESPTRPNETIVGVL